MDSVVLFLDCAKWADDVELGEGALGKLNNFIGCEFVLNNFGDLIRDTKCGGVVRTMYPDPWSFISGPSSVSGDATEDVSESLVRIMMKELPPPQRIERGLWLKLSDDWREHLKLGDSIGTRMGDVREMRMYVLTMVVREH